MEPVWLLINASSTLPPPPPSLWLCAPLFGPQGVVHGDLKAENVLLSAPLSAKPPSICIAKISDFGVSHVFQVHSREALCLHTARSHC